MDVNFYFIYNYDFFNSEILIFCCKQSIKDSFYDIQ